MTNYCYLGGKIVPSCEAKISINDLGVLRGHTVFDYIRIKGGAPIFIEDHLKRFENSAKVLGLKVPLSKTEIVKTIKKLLKKNGLKNATARLVLTGGASDDGLSYDPKSPTFFIIVKELPSWPTDIYKNGVKLMTHEHQREKPEAKSVNYMTLLSLAEKKKKQKAFEVLYTKDDSILEGATSNFFIFKGDTLITPKDKILLGTRRKAILRLAKDHFKVEERQVSFVEINDATEAFISSVTRDIVPVVQIDSHKIDNGKVGKNTKYLMQELKKAIEDYSK